MKILAVLQKQTSSYLALLLRLEKKYLEKNYSLKKLARAAYQTTLPRKQLKIQQKIRLPLFTSMSSLRCACITIRHAEFLTVNFFLEYEILSSILPRASESLRMNWYSMHILHTFMMSIRHK